MSTNTLLPHPHEENTYYIGNAAEASFGIQLDGHVFLRGVHPADACIGEYCVVHNPSEHHMREWILNWRGDRRLMERLCPEHGVGHPDPDDLAFHVQMGDEWQAVHGCCGCC